MGFSSVRQKVLWLSAALSAATLSPSLSQDLAALPGLEETIRSSTAIFLGRVTDARSRWGTPARRWIATDFTFSVEDALLPNASIQKGRTVVLTYPGGTIDGESQGIAGQVSPVKGQRYIMMVSADYDKPGHHPEAGGAGQGLFKIIPERKGRSQIVTDANGTPLGRLVDGRIIRASEAKPSDRKSSVPLESFLLWVRQTAARNKAKPGSPPALRRG